MRILVAAKRATLRDALKTFFQSRPGFNITGTDANDAALLSQVQADMPDLLLLDEELTERLVEEIIIPIQQIDSAPEIVVLGSRQDTKRAVLDAGAVAFINKNDSPRTLLTTIEEIRLGGKSV